MTKTLRLLSLAALLTTGYGDRDVGGQQRRGSGEPVSDRHPDRQPADWQARDGRYRHDAPATSTRR